jgi:hypothetical protein
MIAAPIVSAMAWAICMSGVGKACGEHGRQADKQTEFPVRAHVALPYALSEG